MMPSVLGCSAVPRLAFRVGTNRVLDLAVPLLRPLQIKTGLVFGALQAQVAMHKKSEVKARLALRWNSVFMRVGGAVFSIKAAGPRSRRSVKTANKAVKNRQSA